MVSRSRRLLVLLMLLVLAIILDFLGGISLFGVYHGYDVWGELAMSAGWLLVSGVLVLGAALLLIGLRRWQAYFAVAALASVAASVLYWWVWFTQEEPGALTGFLAGAAWAGAAVAAGLSWSRLLLFRTQRSTARAE